MTTYILTNIGTPQAPTAKAVRPYLNEFLTDPDVIPLPYLLRQFLVRVLIVPRRAPASAEKYRLIWTPSGSPLMVNSLALQAELQKHLRGPVLLGMQYGSPSMESAFAQAKEAGSRRIVLLPLYPQYAEATTGSAIKRARLLGKKMGFDDLRIFPHFPTEEFFLGPLARSLQPETGEHVLFTFHGLPEDQVKQSTPGCLRDPSCCDRPLQERCYRSQSFATARALAGRLGLGSADWTISFQSRLGRAKWIGPYTEDILRQMPARGIKRLLVVSPSFVSDCLETLEELGHQGRSTFLAAGGKSYRLAPCVNADADFARGLAEKLGALGKNE